MYTIKHTMTSSPSSEYRHRTRTRVLIAIFQREDDDSFRVVFVEDKLRQNIQGLPRRDATITEQRFETLHIKIINSLSGHTRVIECEETPNLAYLYWAYPNNTRPAKRLFFPNVAKKLQF